MTEALECPRCHSPMTSHEDVDGLQHLAHARCDGCGYELDLESSQGSPLRVHEWVALGLSAASLFGLVTLTASLEQFQKMFGDAASELPWLTALVVGHQLPIPFLVLGALSTVTGVMRRSKRGGTALLWGGFAIALLGLLVCAAALYLPLHEMAQSIEPD